MIPAIPSATRLHFGEDQHHIDLRRKRTLGGLALESLAAAGAIVLAIIGLAGIDPATLGSLDAILLGAALLLACLTALNEVQNAYRLGVGPKSAAVDLGITALTGIAGVTLGIIDLADPSLAPNLLPVIAIVLGAGMLFAAYPIMFGIRGLPTRIQEDRESHAERGSSGLLHGFAGLGAVVLGIIGAAVSASVTVSLVAFLAAGAAVLLGQGAVAARTAAYMRHQ